jgi:hypothetical protein
MPGIRKLSRRSFVSMVTGGAVAGSLGLVGGDAEAAVLQGCSDSDPIGSGGDPGGRGRRCANQPQTGCSDTDSGSGGDPGGRGVRCANRPVTGCSDSDRGSGSDPGQRGTRCGPGNGLACIDCDCPGFIPGPNTQGDHLYRCMRPTCGHGASRHY